MKQANKYLIQGKFISMSNAQMFAETDFLISEICEVETKTIIRTKYEIINADFCAYQCSLAGNGGEGGTQG
jgi:hypothetical protein